MPTRAELNAEASAFDIDEPEKLPNKAAVEAAIKAADLTIALSATKAIERDLRALAKRDPELARSTRAAAALVLAREMDSPNSATSKSMCAKALGELMDRLEELAPEELKEDTVARIQAYRSARRAAS